MVQIIPSLASADQLNLAAALDSVAGVDRLHLDIEDGNFIPNITFGMKTVKAVMQYASKKIDAHLMVTQPELYIDDLLNFGISGICIHAQAVQYPAVYLGKIQSAGARAGLAFNFGEPVEIARYYIEYLDYVLIMTAEPDPYSQRFNETVLYKIEKARKELPERISIAVDGGISESNMARVLSAGADTVVMGRAIWEAEKPTMRYAQLMRQANLSDHERGR